MLWGISETVNARAFKPLPLCSAPLKVGYYLPGFCVALGMQESHCSGSKNVSIGQNGVGYLSQVCL